MAIMQEHLSNGSDCLIFKNDWSSQNDVQQRQRQQKEADEDAVRRQKESEEADRQERERIEEKAEELVRLQSEIADLMQTNSELLAKKIKLDEHNYRLLGEMRQLVEADEQRKAALLPDVNNLDPSFHGKTVNIVFRKGDFGIDFGGDRNLSQAYLWNADLHNGNQRLKLEKVDPNDPKSLWRIRLEDCPRYMEFRHGTVEKLDTYYARDDLGWTQQWQIGRVQSMPPGVYCIGNSYYKKNLTCERTPSNCANLTPCPPNTEDERQHFVIIAR